MPPIYVAAGGHSDLQAADGGQIVVQRLGLTDSAGRKRTSANSAWLGREDSNLRMGE